MFEVTARTAQLSASDRAAVEVVGAYAVDAAIVPQRATTGAGMTVAYTLVVTNVGTLADAYRLTPTVPTGWSAEIVRNGSPISALDLLAGIGHSAELSLLVTPNIDATTDAYQINVFVQSLNDGAMMAEPTAETIHRRTRCHGCAHTST